MEISNYHFSYWAITITLPVKKYFNGKLYGSMSADEQKNILNTCLPDSMGEYFYISYEEHPNRKGGLHLHCILRSQGKNSEFFKEYFWNALEKKSKCDIIRSIAKIDKLKSEQDIIRWANYCKKEDENHNYLLSEYEEHMLDKFNSGRMTIESRMLFL